MGETRIMRATSGYIHNYGSKTPINIDIDEEFAYVMLAKVEEFIVDKVENRDFDQLTELVDTREELVTAINGLCDVKCNLKSKDEEDE